MVPLLEKFVLSAQEDYFEMGSIHWERLKKKKDGFRI